MAHHHRPGLGQVLLRRIAALLPPQAAQLFHRVIGGLPGLVDQLLGLFPGVLQQLFPLLLNGGIGLFRLLLVFLCFLPLSLSQLQLVFHLLPLFFQGADHIFKLDVLAVHAAFGLLNDLHAQPQPLGNGKGVGFARDTEHQLVGGLQSGHIKLAGGVFHAPGLQSIGFQLGIVGGGRHQYPLLPQMLDDGHGQGRAFHRVGAGAQLIHQHHAAFSRLFQNLYNILHMRGEGGQ